VSSKQRPGSTAEQGAGGSTTEIADETAGPFPGDGSNGPNVLTDSDVVRMSVDAVTAAGSKLKTSQLALSPKACEQAYAAASPMA